MLAFRKTLPPEDGIEVGGVADEGAKSQTSVQAVLPVILPLASILMTQLHSFRKLFLAVSVAPLGLIGVVASLLISASLSASSPSSASLLFLPALHLIWLRIKPPRPAIEPDRRGRLIHAYGSCRG